MTRGTSPAARQNAPGVQMAGDLMLLVVGMDLSALRAVGRRRADPGELGASPLPRALVPSIQTTSTATASNQPTVRHELRDGEGAAQRARPRPCTASIAVPSLGARKETRPTLHLALMLTPNQQRLHYSIRRDRVREPPPSGWFRPGCRSARKRYMLHAC